MPKRWHQRRSASAEARGSALQDFWGPEKHTFTVARGLTSWLRPNDGAEIYSKVTADDVISIISPVVAAKARGNALFLTTTRITVDPGDYTGNYWLTTVGREHPRSGPRTFTVVKGLMYGWDNTSTVKDSIFSFKVD
jgi:hypothetical protein